jgi:hypothetical protein
LLSTPVPQHLPAAHSSRLISIHDTGCCVPWRLLPAAAIDVQHASLMPCCLPRLKHSDHTSLCFESAERLSNAMPSFTLSQPRRHLCIFKPAAAVMSKPCSTPFTSRTPDEQSAASTAHVLPFQEPRHTHLLRWQVPWSLQFSFWMGSSQKEQGSQLWLVTGCLGQLLASACKPRLVLQARVQCPTCNRCCSGQQASSVE